MLMSRLTSFSPIFLPGHGDKGDRFDPGAVADLDQDGQVETDEVEATLARAGAEKCMGVLASSLYYPASLNEKSYAERHKMAKTMAEKQPNTFCPFVFWHINASAHSDQPLSAVIYDKRSHWGQLFAESILESAVERVEEEYTGRARTWSVGPGETDRARRNQFYLVRQPWELANSCGVLVEAYMIHSLIGKSPQVIAKLNQDMGIAVADGLMTGWLRLQNELRG